MSPETPQRCPLCDSDRQDIREMIYHPTEDAQCFDPWHDPWHTAPVPAIPSGNNLAIGGESGANITEREASPEPLRMLKQEIAEALEPDLNCGYCHGSGAMDSGGVTPWGTGIDIRCNCTYPEPAAAPTGTPRPIRQAGKHLRSITTPVEPAGQDDPESDESAEFSYQLLSSSIVPEQIPEPDKIAPTGTGERSEWSVDTLKRLCRKLRAEKVEFFEQNAALRSQLEEAQQRLDIQSKDCLKAIEAAKTAERDLATAQQENVKLQHELADDEIELRGARNLEKTYISVKNALATAQARIARLEQALRQVNHLQHSLAIEQDGTGNMRIEYWTREIEDVVVEALNPAEPQSGEK